MGLETVHTPLWQVSVCVQASPSLQVVPLGVAGLDQVPVGGSQVPASCPSRRSSDLLGLEPVHTPLWQVSVCVQASPSLQVVPLSAAGLEQVPVEGSQVPATWH